MDRDARDRIFRNIGLEELDTVAREIVAFAGKETLWLFQGEMGAGKTTLIKALGRELGVHDSMSSPTFALVNEYQAAQKKKIYHFDFYRIKNETEAYDIGVDEYFDSGAYCFVEWPEKIQNILPAEHAEIKITLENNTHRTIAISIHGGKEENGF